MKILISLFVVSLIETCYLKSCISVTEKKNAKNTSTGHNKINNYTVLLAPEKPIEPTAIATFGSENML